MPYQVRSLPIRRVAAAFVVAMIGIGAFLNAGIEHSHDGGSASHSHAGTAHAHEHGHTHQHGHSHSHREEQGTASTTRHTHFSWLFFEFSITSPDRPSRGRAYDLTGETTTPPVIPDLLERVSSIRCVLVDRVTSPQTDVVTHQVAVYSVADFGIGRGEPTTPPPEMI